MNIGPFTTKDIGQFLQLAGQEGWLSEYWECAFLLSRFSRGCLVCRQGGGEPVGFVTALQHDRSGWIGNLIVAPAERGKGIGERLFCTALEALRDAGVQTVWLTASPSGQPLYEKHGFIAIDAIVRWSGFGNMSAGRGCRPVEEDSLSRVFQIDRLTWGDRRDDLLGKAIRRGTLFREEFGYLVTQPCMPGRQIGPFSALDANRAARMFDSAVASIPRACMVYLDTPAGNRAAAGILAERQMREAGRTVLMYAGERPAYRPEYLYGLATMGSCG